MSESTVIASFKPGELGVGVGFMERGIESRGEKPWVFHSVVWFPADALEEAREFAAQCIEDGGRLTTVKEGVPL